MASRQLLLEGSFITHHCSRDVRVRKCLRFRLKSVVTNSYNNTGTLPTACSCMLADAEALVAVTVKGGRYAALMLNALARLAF